MLPSPGRMGRLTSSGLVVTGGMMRNRLQWTETTRPSQGMRGSGGLDVFRPILGRTYLGVRESFLMLDLVLVDQLNRRVDCFLKNKNNLTFCILS